MIHSAPSSGLGTDFSREYRSGDSWKGVPKAGAWEQIETTAWLLSFIAGFAVLLAGVGMMIIWRAVARPLDRITRVTEQVASGTTGNEIPYRERGDEIGGLARSIAVFQDAMRQNEELSKTVIDDARARVRRQEQMSTEIVAFSVSNQVTVRIRDVAASGDVLDDVVAAGANQINSIRFDVAEPEPLRDEAMAAAIADARRKAELMAEAAGVELVRILSVSAFGGGVPQPEFALARNSVPIVAGQQAISANATVVYESAPQ